MQPLSLARILRMLVAGPGIEPGSQGYEPYEIPLLHPACNQSSLTAKMKMRLVTQMHCTRKT